MIPISDYPGPRRRFPIVNYALIAANIVVFLLELQHGDCFIEAYSTIPAAITSGTPATIQGCALTQPTPVYLTLLTSMFLHANLLHVGGNMLYLWIFGDNVEDRLGHIPYFIFYLFCGLVASVAQIAVSPDSKQINLGASGAIAGVLGAYIVFFPGARVRTLIFLGFFITLANLSAFIVIGLWFVLQLVSSVQELNPQMVQAGGVAYMAHVGGFVAGLIIALLLKPFMKQPRRYKQFDTTYPYWPRHPDLRGF